MSSPIAWRSGSTSAETPLAGSPIEPLRLSASPAPPPTSNRPSTVTSTGSSPSGTAKTPRIPAATAVALPTDADIATCRDFSDSPGRMGGIAEASKSPCASTSRPPVPMEIDPWRTLIPRLAHALGRPGSWPLKGCQVVAGQAPTPAQQAAPAASAAARQTDAESAVAAPSKPAVARMSTGSPTAFGASTRTFTSTEPTTGPPKQKPAVMPLTTTPSGTWSELWTAPSTHRVPPA